VYAQRPLAAETAAAHAAAAAAGQPVFAVLPPVRTQPGRPYAGAKLLPPGSADPANGVRFWLGTDIHTRDVLATMVNGTRVSLTIGILATALSMLIGVAIGAVSGYCGGWTDLLLQRLVEIMMCFPTFLLILVVVAIMGPNLITIVVVIGLTDWAGTARLVRGEFLAQAGRDYVLAARALGFGAPRIIVRHILPNALTPLLISASFGIAGTVSLESGLAFLGLGDPAVSSWGGVLEQGRQQPLYLWLIIPPGAAIFCLVLALNTLGNGLREVLDPRAVPR
jgi:peptide/nickel transport system permease protein